MPPKDKQNEVAAGSVSAASAETAPAQDGFSLISNQKLLQLYATMLKCRLLEERIRAESERLRGSGDARRGIPLPPRGREAAVAGVLMDLLSEDTVSADPLDLIPRFVNGTPLATLFGVLRQSISPSSQSSSTPYISATAGVANHAETAKKIGVVFSGGDAEQRSWTEALRLASLHQHPTIFVCWKPRKAPALDFPVMTVDACDVVAVYRVASESIAHARQGFGPTLIECLHWNGPGATRNPLVNMEKYLDRKGLFDKAMRAKIRVGFRAELDAAAEVAKNASSRRGPRIQL
ncbi:MAG: thiamine pyrophosphate-dependent enzyme [Terracidiphilus sp.]